MINNVSIVGKAGTDPKIHSFQGGNKVAKLSMAIQRPTKEKETDWVDIQIWGKQAEVAEKYIKKGHTFGIEGRLQQEKWEKDGVKQSRLIVVANNVRLMNPKGSDKAEGGGEKQQDFFGNDNEFPE